jgi:hypothetical protein
MTNPEREILACWCPKAPSQSVVEYLCYFQPQILELVESSALFLNPSNIMGDHFETFRGGVDFVMPEVSSLSSTIFWVI